MLEVYFLYKVSGVGGKLSKGLQRRRPPTSPARLFLYTKSMGDRPGSPWTDRQAGRKPDKAGPLRVVDTGLETRRLKKGDPVTAHWATRVV